MRKGWRKESEKCQLMIVVRSNQGQQSQDHVRNWKEVRRGKEGVKCRREGEDDSWFGMG